MTVALKHQDQAHFPGIFGTDRHVFMASGGVGSLAGVRRIVAQHGADLLTLLFCDTLIEHRDCYRLMVYTAFEAFGLLDAPATSQIFQLIDALPDYHDDPVARVQQLVTIKNQVVAAAPNVVWLADGRDPWQVFFDRKFLGNSMVDPCSAKLKREIADQWLRSHCDPAVTTVYVGMDWTEEHLFVEARDRYARMGYRCKAPLCEAPLLPIDWKTKLIEELKDLGLCPELYLLGFPHNNCGGFCVKAGQAFFALLLRVRPQVYAYHEGKEQEIRAILGDVSILKDRRGGETRPLTLRDFRIRLQGGGDFDRAEFGGCGCFVGHDLASPESHASEAELEICL